MNAPARPSVMDLSWPMRCDERERMRVITQMREDGVAIHREPAVLADVAEVTHTVGLYAQRLHPELLVIGLPAREAEWLLGDIVAKVLEGQSVPTFVRTRWLTGSWSALATSPRRMLEFVPISSVFRGVLPALEAVSRSRSVPLLQLLYSDAHGRFPGETGVDPALARRQPRWDRAPWAHWARAQNPAIDGRRQA